MNRRFEALMDELRARHEEKLFEFARYTKQAVEDWQLLAPDGDAASAILREFGIAADCDEQHENWALLLALSDIGIRYGRIVREPSFRVDVKKAERDAELGRPTMHLAPQWRHPLGASGFLREEEGAPALILPVARAAKFATTLSLTGLGEHEFARNIADLIAIPLDGGRPLSLTGYTVAIGDLAVDDRGRLVIYGSGKAWLDAWLARVREITAETPPHLVEQLHLRGHASEFGGVTETIEPPTGALILEPRAIEWRLYRFDCAIPEAARKIICPDSRKLAELIDAAMRKKDPRPVPVVRGPAAQSEMAAA